jgi:hypothetical protein
VLSAERELQVILVENQPMSQHLQRKIKNDVRKWSEEFLEIPNKHLGGFPACPFAKKTWKDDKVIIEVKRKFKTI